MKRSFSFVLLLTFISLIPFCLQAKVVVDKIAAVVNNEIITLSELEQATELSNKNSEEKIDKRAMLKKLIDEKILNQEATKRGVTISEEEVDLLLQQVKQQNNFDDKAMEEELAKQNMTVDDLKNQFKTQLLTRRLLDAEMQGKIAVTEDEILEYYRANYGDVEFGSQVRIAHILIPYDEENAYEKAVNIAKEAKSGENFSKLAKEHSKDSVSATKGGDLGYFNKGDLVFELEAAIEDTEVGEVTDPVETGSGYHIVKVLEKEKSSEASLGGYREQIRQTIYRQKSESFLKNWVEKSRQNVFIDIKI